MQGIKRVKIIALSDTHSNFDQFKQLISNKIKGDFFIFAGDFTRYGREEHFKKFFYYLQQLQFKHKIVIAGNHQISLDKNIQQKRKQKLLERFPCELSYNTIIQQLRKRCIYLVHDLIEIQGITIFASPFTQYYSKGAFQYSADQDAIIWNTLPQKIDILVTHSPPYGILDKTSKDKNAGSINLRKKVLQICPKIHIFGHIHEGHGRIKINNTIFINVAKKYQQIILE